MQKQETNGYRDNRFNFFFKTIQMMTRLKGNHKIGITTLKKIHKTKALNFLLLTLFNLILRLSAEKTKLSHSVF